MDERTFRRARRIAVRMARTCFGRKRRPDARWIAARVAEFFDEYVADGGRNLGHEDAGHGGTPGAHDLVRTYLGELADLKTIPDEPPMIDRKGACPSARWEAWEIRWWTPVARCIETGVQLAAGCDPRAATLPPCDALKLDVGTVRRIFGARLPRWLAAGCVPPEAAVLAGRPADAVLTFGIGTVRA